MWQTLGVGILPLGVLVAFPLLWWRGTRAGRLSFAVLTPLMLLCGLQIGSDAADSGGTCLSGPCDHLVGSMAGLDATINQPIFTSCALALLVGAPFGLMTVLVDVLTAFGDRSEDAG